TAAAQLSRTVDTTRPSVTLSSAAPNLTNATSFSVTATFSSAVTGFALGDVAVGNGTASGFSGSGASYTFTVTPAADGTVTVDLGAGAATDAAGNASTAAAQLTRTVDTNAPAAPPVAADPVTTTPVTTTPVTTTPVTTTVPTAPGAAATPAVKV